MLKCNFSCNYCVAAAGQTQVSGTDYSKGGKRNVWGIENGRQNVRTAIEWAASLPYRVGVRYDVHGEPLLNADVIEDITWLSQQENVDFVEIQTNGSLFKRRLPKLAEKIDVKKLKLFCTFHHKEISIDDYMENVIFAQEAGFDATVNTLLSEENVSIIKEALERCKAKGIPTSGDLLFPGFDVPVTEKVSEEIDVDKRARHFLSHDPFKHLEEAGPRGREVFDVVADSGPLGKEIRFLAALLVGLYGKPGRSCSAGHDYIIVDNWGDVYPCTSYADVQMGKLGSVLTPGFVPKLREETYAPCQYKETCHQKEEYGNLRILREHRDLTHQTLNNFSGGDKEVDVDQLVQGRLAMIEMARENFELHGAPGKQACSNSCE